MLLGINYRVNNSNGNAAIFPYVHSSQSTDCHSAEKTLLTSIFFMRLTMTTPFVPAISSVIEQTHFEKVLSHKSKYLTY